jgi:hypothetical protein
VSAAFLDFDRDGWLDLVVGNYVDYDPTQVCHDVQGRQDFCAPQAFAGTVTRLWRNVTGTPGATPRFEDYTERSGLSRVSGAALGIVCADFDGDGWPDIFCADDGRPNRLFVNQCNGTFCGRRSQPWFWPSPLYRTAANIRRCVRRRGRRRLGDLFATHLAEEFHSFFRQDPRGLFTDAVARTGLQQQNSARTVSARRLRTDPTGT